MDLSVPMLSTAPSPVSGSAAVSGVCRSLWRAGRRMDIQTPARTRDETRLLDAQGGVNQPEFGFQPVVGVCSGGEGGGGGDDGWRPGANLGW